MVSGKVDQVRRRVVRCWERASGVLRPARVVLFYWLCGPHAHDFCLDRVLSDEYYTSRPGGTGALQVLKCLKRRQISHEGTKTRRRAKNLSVKNFFGTWCICGKEVKGV